jgi:hypothetical protein
MMMLEMLTNLLRKTAFTVPLLGLCAIPVIVEIYSKLPARASNFLLPIKDPVPLLPQSFLESNSQEVAVLFPGFGGPDMNTERIINEMTKDGVTAYCYDWEEYRGNLFRAASSGTEIGAQLGAALGAQLTSSESSVERVHFIGISVGSFAANSCLESFVSSVNRKQKTNMNSSKKDTRKCSTRATFLDPFTSKGVFGIGFGVRTFGRMADYAEQYLNTDDPVPSTNEPCAECHCFDITECRDRVDFVPLPDDNMHSWPAAYYGINYRDRIAPQLASRSHASFPRGRVSKIA